MPKQSSKKFIDKKKSVSFQLVQRSQQDPLAADDTAPQNVLRPVYKGQKKHLDEFDRASSCFDYEAESRAHMKDPNDRMMAWPEGVEETLQERMAKIQAELPKEVFPSNVEEPVGLLNKGTELSGLQVNLDPEVREALEAMEDDYDFNNPENNLDDDFVAMADGVRSDDDGEGLNDDDEEDVGSDGLFSDLEEMQEETMEKKSYYSMISHTTRTEQLDLMEAKFQRLYDEEYANGRHKPNTEYTDGYLDLKATEDMIYAEIDKLEKEKEGWKYTPSEDQDVKQKTLQLYSSKVVEESSSDSDTKEAEANNDKKEDVEEMDEAPKYMYKVMIPPPLKPRKAKIQVNPRTGVPTNVMGMNKLTTKALDAFNSSYEGGHDRADELKSVRSLVSELSVRNKDEQPEERRQRKALFKEYQAQRRAEKKANVMAFKELNLELQKVEANRNKNKVLTCLT